MNEFASTSIFLPKEFQPYLRMYCSTHTEGTHSNPKDSPFPRMVDMWFMAVCIAVKEELKPNFDTRKETYKPIEGVVFGSDGWRSNALMLLAISYTGNVEVTRNPREMMRIANAYALAGLPRLINILEEDRKGDTALDHLSEVIGDMIGHPQKL